MAFVDAAYANDQHKQRSTTGFVFTYCGGAIVYRSKTQSITVISSTYHPGVRLVGRIR